MGKSRPGTVNTENYQFPAGLLLVKPGLCSVTNPLHRAIILQITRWAVGFLESGDDTFVVDSGAKIVVGGYVRSVSYQARSFGPVRDRDVARDALYVASLMVRTVMNIICEYTACRHDMAVCAEEIVLPIVLIVFDVVQRPENAG